MRRTDSTVAISRGSVTGPKFLVSHPEDIEHEVVAANKNVGAQNIDRSDGERAGDVGQQLLAVPGAD